MKSIRVQKEIVLPETISVLLAELEEEIQNVLKLLAQLRLPGLTREQAENILGELSAALTHLHKHSEGLDELILEAKLQEKSFP